MKSVVTAEILTYVNNELSVDNDACMFVTVFLCILNLRTGEMTYTNAGHNPPLIRTAGGSVRPLDQKHGPVLGAVEGVVYGEDRIVLSSGDLILLYTDGVTEAMNTSRELFSEARVTASLEGNQNQGAEVTVQAVRNAVLKFEGEAEQADDITILAVKFA